MPAPGSAHGLGPHVVGRRVVVRRVVPGETGPSGGPAMTDVLGTLTSWGGSTCVVEPESGPSVTIRLADIVSGKPVPPRASMRQRVGSREAELHARPLWPQVEREPLGEWELRSDPASVGRLRKRANSCLAFGDPGVPTPDAVDAVRRFYGARGRVVLAQVEIGSDPEAELGGLGWTPVPGGDAHFLLTSTAHALRSAGPADDVEVGADVEVGVEIEEDGPRVHVVRRASGREIASARAGIDGDWLGLHGLAVDREHRGRGHGTALVRALLAWGAERGATTAWLHVETDNAPALALYDRLGFVTHHTNTYLTPPD